MSMPEFLLELIDRASRAAGSQTKLADMLLVPRTRVSNWKSGSQPCPAADIALMAHVAGMDAEAWASRALVAQYEGTPKGELLASVLGKALQATGAVIASSGAKVAAMAVLAAKLLCTVPDGATGYFIRCILC